MAPRVLVRDYKPRCYGGAEHDDDYRVWWDEACSFRCEVIGNLPGSDPGPPGSSPGSGAQSAMG